MNLDKISYELYLNGLNEPYDDSIDPSILPPVEMEIGKYIPIEWLTTEVKEIFGNIIKVCDYGFAGRPNLTNVNLPVCENIGRHAFEYCYSLTSVNLPVCGSVGDMAFQYGSNLTEINLPNCRYVGSYAFEFCTSLTNVDLPVCKSIVDYAFIYCASLTNINLPVCESIGSYAFYSCRSLESIYLTNSSVVTLVDKNAFGNTPMSTSSYLGHFGSIYVPASLLSQYQSATNWSEYSERFAGIMEE